MKSNPAGGPVNSAESAYWFSRHSKSVIFVILTLALVGGYLAFSIPVAVFPATNFPRILIAVDNGVMPTDQMMVTITRPIEEAVNSVPGLQEVRSITSRGSAEIDLFFDWNVDMFQTLQYVNAAISRVQVELPPTASVVANRMTFASFPIIGYSLTSQTVPQTQLWEMATYEIKPRLNRLDGVSTVLVQGGQQPEFHITPDPAKLLTANVTVTDILDTMRRTNLIDSPGLFERNHQLVLALVSGQVQTPQQIADAVIKNTPAGVPVRIGDVATVAPGVKPVYTIVTANGKPAVLININRQPESNTVQVADEVHAQVEEIRKSLPPGIEIRPFYDQSIIVGDSIKSVRDAILLGLILASIILVVFLRDWGTSIVAGLVIPVTVLVTFVALKLLNQSFNLMTLGGLAAAVGLVIDDAIVVVENIVLHRDAGEGRLQAIHGALAGDHDSADRFHDHSRGRVSAADFHHRSYRNIFPRPGRDHGHIAVRLTGAGLDLDPQSQPVLHPPAQGFAGEWRTSQNGRKPGSIGRRVYLAAARGRRTQPGRILPQDRRLPCALVEAGAGSSPVAGGDEPGAGGRFILLLSLFRLRPDAGNG